MVLIWEVSFLGFNLLVIFCFIFISLFDFTGYVSIIMWFVLFYFILLFLFYYFIYSLVYNLFSYFIIDINDCIFMVYWLVGSNLCWCNIDDTDIYIYTYIYWLVLILIDIVDFTDFMGFVPYTYMRDCYISCLSYYMITLSMCELHQPWVGCRHYNSFRGSVVAFIFHALFWYCLYPVNDFI